jgi:hypothetical protein
MIAIHKTFEKDENHKRTVTFFVADGKKVQKLTDQKIEKWLDGQKTSEIRVTAVHACDPFLADLAKRGHTVLYANWHALGIEKNLAPEGIATAFADADSSSFRTFEPRPDLAALRYRLSQRFALTEYRKAVILRLKGSGRLYGQLSEEDLDLDTKALLKEADETETRVPVQGKNGTKMVSLDTVIANLAKEIRECVLFNSAAQITGSWTTAATVVAFSGGIDRFESVASFWHYCGEHVVDGSAPKRRRGQPVTWNPRVRTALWNMSDSIMKNRDNPWRDFYDRERAKEFENHMAKHPGCKHPNGHSTARALRKMRKEILKRFFLAVKGESYREGCDQGGLVNHITKVAA